MQQQSTILMFKIEILLMIIDFCDSVVLLTSIPSETSIRSIYSVYNIQTFN